MARRKSLIGKRNSFSGAGIKKDKSKLNLKIEKISV
jgi:hypothetical protein